LSKVIKSFNNRKETTKNHNKGVVIGIQSLSLLTQASRSLTEDDETKMLRLKNEAQNLLDEARKEADRLLAEAEMLKKTNLEKLDQEEEAWRIRMEQEAEKAKSDGYEAGFQRGLEQGNEKWLSQLNEVKCCMDQLRSDYYSILDESEPQMIVLAVRAAEKIIGMKLQETPEAWTSIVKRLVKEAREFEEIKLYVSPKWFELTLNYREELMNILQSTATLFIYPDETLDENGAVIEFPFGKIDATLDVQLKEIREKLLEKVEVTDQ
jgi:flagellar assembly protein FliH